MFLYRNKKTASGLVIIPTTKMTEDKLTAAKKRRLVSEIAGRVFKK